MGFDGLDLVVLPATGTDRLASLYVDVMGFELVHEDPDPDPAWTGLLGLSRPAERVVQLMKPGARGGSILLVETPGLPPGGTPGAPARRGPYALDFYVRDSNDIESRLERAGWSFTSEPIHYLLPGTQTPVRERMLVQDVSGLLHAIVQHRPMGTRSILGEDPDQDCSEVVAVVCLTPELDDARRFALEGLGGREYFAGAFEGPEIELMLSMEAGERLDAFLYRGPTSRNARLEFAWRPSSDPGEPAATLRAVLGLRVDDMTTADGWDGEFGTAGPIVRLRIGEEHLSARRFDSHYDVTLLLLAPPC